MVNRVGITLHLFLAVVNAELSDYMLESRALPAEGRAEGEEDEYAYPVVVNLEDSPKMITVDDFNQHANRVLTKTLRDYLQDGTDKIVTVRENSEAFYRYRIRSRAMSNSSHVDTSVELFGHRIEFPVGICPMAFHKLYHPDGEMATARAAAKAGAVFALSTYTNTPLEDIAKLTPSGLRWKQVYMYRNRAITERIVRQAEKSGYKAIVLTVDSPTIGNKVNDRKNKLKIPSHLRMPNFAASHPSPPGGPVLIRQQVISSIDNSTTWNDLAWVKSLTTLPIVAKGILRGDDAVQAIRFGANGIVVSNHGGRQMDEVPAAIEALPEVVKAVNGSVEVFLDGGVRTGTDIFKALAMGARAVFVGRPAIWGLIHSGEAGTQRVLEILKEELQRTMTLAGTPSVKDIRPSDVVRDKYYANLWKPEIPPQYL